MKMKIEKAKQVLIEQATKRWAGKEISFCGSKKNWDDCFTKVEFDGNEELLFWYDIGKATFMEKIAIN